MITDQQLAEALDVQRRTGGRLGEILIDLEFITSVDAAEILAERLGMPFVNLDVTPIDEIVAQRIPEEIARRYRAIPIEEEDGVLRVAVADPTDVFALDDLQVITRGPVIPVVADPAQLIEAANRIWTRPSMESRIDDASDLEADEPTHLLVSDAEDAPIIRLVDAMIGQATDERASDIHIEPAGDRVRIRFRVDGVLHDASSTPKNVLRPVVSRLKVMGGCDISNSRTPQDGRFSVHGRDRHVDVRLTTLPTSTGEAVVLRLLDKTHGIFDLGALGFEPDELARYQAVVPHLAGRDHLRRADRLGQDVDALRDAARAERPWPGDRRASRTRSSTTSTGSSRSRSAGAVGSASPAPCARSCAPTRT